MATDAEHACSGATVDVSTGAATTVATTPAAVSKLTVLHEETVSAAAPPAAPTAAPPAPPTHDPPMPPPSLLASSVLPSPLAGSPPTPDTAAAEPDAASLVRIMLPLGRALPLCFDFNLATRMVRVATDDPAMTSPEDNLLVPWTRLDEAPLRAGRVPRSGMATAELWACLPLNVKQRVVTDTALQGAVPAHTTVESFPEAAEEGLMRAMDFAARPSCALCEQPLTDGGISCPYCHRITYCSEECVQGHLAHYHICATHVVTELRQSLYSGDRRARVLAGLAEIQRLAGASAAMAPAALRMYQLLCDFMQVGGFCEVMEQPILHIGLPSEPGGACSVALATRGQMLEAKLHNAEIDRLVTYLLRDPRAPLPPYIDPTKPYEYEEFRLTRAADPDAYTRLLQAATDAAAAGDATAPVFCGRFAGCNGVAYLGVDFSVYQQLVKAPLFMSAAHIAALRSAATPPTGALTLACNTDPFLRRRIVHRIIGIEEIATYMESRMQHAPPDALFVFFHEPLHPDAAQQHMFGVLPLRLVLPMFAPVGTEPYVPAARDTVVDFYRSQYRARVGEHALERVISRTTAGYTRAGASAAECERAVARIRQRATPPDGSTYPHNAGLMRVQRVAVEGPAAADDMPATEVPVAAAAITAVDAHTGTPATGACFTGTPSESATTGTAATTAPAASLAAAPAAETAKKVETVEAAAADSSATVALTADMYTHAQMPRNANGASAAVTCSQADLQARIKSAIAHKKAERARK